MPPDDGRGDSQLLTLVSEWDSREALDGFISSREFLILQGMRMVLRDDPQVILDEILLRSRMSLGARSRFGRDCPLPTPTMSGRSRPSRPWSGASCAPTGALVQVLTFREKSCPKPCIVDGGCCRVFETMRLGVNDE